MTELDLLAVSAKASAVSAVLSLVAVGIMCWSLRKADAQRKMDIIPVLGLANVSAGVRLGAYAINDDGSPVDPVQYLDCTRHPVFLAFKNVGKGPANLLVIDLDQPYDANIGTPISIGSDRDATVKVWLPKDQEMHAVKMALYYWDPEGTCYATQTKVGLKYVEVDDPEYPDLVQWRMSTERYSRVKEERPAEVLHWPREELFHEIQV